MIPSAYTGLIALDGEQAASTGWIQQLHELGRHSTNIHIPDGKDPADWIAEHGPHDLAILGLPSLVARTHRGLSPDQVPHH